MEQPKSERLGLTYIKLDFPLAGLLFDPEGGMFLRN
jgi:hypothetical protein